MSFLREVKLDEGSFPPFVAFHQAYGFVPNLYRAQTLRPDFLPVEMDLIGTILRKEGALSRRQKEYILLVSAAANQNTYCVTVHSEFARLQGLTDPDPDELAADHRSTDLPDADKALLDFAVKLTLQSSEVSDEDVQVLRRHGFGDQQILEAVAMVALNSFFNLLAAGLGAVPDAAPKTQAAQE